MAKNLMNQKVCEWDGDQHLIDKRENRQLWCSAKGHWGVVEIVDNKYSIILECQHRQEVARFVFEHYPGH